MCQGKKTAPEGRRENPPRGYSMSRKALTTSAATWGTMALPAALNIPILLGILLASGNPADAMMISLSV